jgi:hypothetical protein
LLPLNVPPLPDVVSVIAEPCVTVVGPLMVPALGIAVTVTTLVAVAEPQMPPTV